MARKSDIEARATRQLRELSTYAKLFEHGRASPIISRDVDGGFEADVAVVRKACGVVTITKAEDDEGGILRAVDIVASTPQVDSMGDIIVQSGWQSSISIRSKPFPTAQWASIFITNLACDIRAPSFVAALWPMLSWCTTVTLG